MKSTILLAVVATFALAASGCGKEVGRISFGDAGSKTTHVDLAAKELVFWSDVDLEWKGAGSASYEIDVWGRVYGRLRSSQAEERFERD